MVVAEPALMLADRQAAAIGSIAQEELALERSAWNVLASVSGAVYIQRSPDGLLWVTDRESALHSRAILIYELPSFRPRAGSLCRVQHGALSFGSSWRVGCRNAAHWVPGRRKSSLPDLRVILGRLERVLAIVARLSPPQSMLASVMPFVESGQEDWIEREILLSAQQSIRICQQAAASDNLLNTIQSCRGLVGLGSGLTPAGDDFLAAYLFTMRFSERVDSGCSCIHWENIRTWLRSESCRTNVISLTLLLDCAGGVASAPLHEFVNAVLSGADIDELAIRAHSLAGIGHSSGWDMLTGVHAAITSLSNSKCGVLAADSVNRHAVCRKEAVGVR